MSAPAPASAGEPATRLERVSGAGAPRVRSVWWLPAAACVALYSAYVLLSDAARGTLEPQSFINAAVLLLVLQQACDVGGSLLFLRRGAGWARRLRALSYLLLLPPAILLYLLWSRALGPPWLFLVMLGLALLFAADLARKLVGELRNAEGSG